MTDHTTTTPPPETEARTAPRMRDTLPRIGRVAFYLFSVLIAVWAMGRLLEGLSGHTVFDPWLVRGIGVATGLMALIALLAWIVQSANAVAAERRQLRIYPAWLLLLLMALAGVFLLPGYAVSVSGLFAMLSGSFQQAELAAFTLIKSHPTTPLLAVNLAFLKLFHGGFDVNLLAPFAWRMSFLLAFFIWGIVIGTLLLFLRGLRGTKCVHLILAIAGALLTMHLKSQAALQISVGVYLHAAAAGMMIFQLLLVYAALRRSLPVEALARRRLPSALALGAAALLLIPVTTDLYRQHTAASSWQPLARPSQPVAPGAREAILVAPLSVHNGPAYGDTILGQLPARTKVVVVEKKNGWARIGPGRWIREDYLSPVTAIGKAHRLGRAPAGDRS
jgi:hypothetical protein